MAAAEINPIHAEDFDPHFYYNMVAKTLLRNFGDRALFYADEALTKMHALGDEDGFDVWLCIHQHLSTHASDAMRDGATAIH